MSIDLTEWEKKCEDVCVPCKCLLQGGPAGNDFNNQVDGVPHSVDTIKTHPPVTLSLHNELMNKVAMVAKMEVMHGLSNMDL